MFYVCSANRATVASLSSLPRLGRGLVVAYLVELVKKVFVFFCFSLKSGGQTSVFLFPQILTDFGIFIELLRAAREDYFLDTIYGKNGKNCARSAK